MMIFGDFFFVSFVKKEFKVSWFEERDVSLQICIVIYSLLSHCKFVNKIYCFKSEKGRQFLIWVAMGDVSCCI